ncbi:D-alanyl-D-alanine carboxypeptidase [Streptomyces hirsutus]|uniref:D-alanyl-D-alanine carboxypeptidase n=1 Tax=Streptomyces hirsutus TaxID=35620 RepID=UPI003F4CB46A
MEEASVAGESPDRSKQRESSEEPTPGSAGPVPEARSEGGAAGKRDPRLPVTRDTSSPSPSSTASASVSTSDSSTSSSKATASANDRGGVDTATRVLSVRDTQTEGEEAEDSVEAAGSGAAESGSVDSESESTDGKPDGRDDSATEGDGRLHAVVTAWVRSAEEVDQDEDGESAQGAQGAQDSAGGDTGAKNGPEDGKDGSASRDEGSSGASEGGAADDTGTTGESEESDGADAGDEPGSARDTDSDAETDSETESEADADTAPEDEAAPAAEDDGDSTSGSADGDDTDASPEPQTEADAEPEPEGTKATPEPSADKADDGDDGEGTGDAKPPTDQPTAVFKAPRPPAPAVDQPTTMLKLGDAAKEADEAERVDRSDSKGDSKGGAAPESVPDADPESGPERAGTFVPLKDLDAPETRKPPKRVDSATTSLRLPPSAQAQPAAPPVEGTRAVPQVGPELTRQQPLPPKPPLDLLAELTNTPPPPDTPLRTTLRRVKVWTPLVALLVIVFAVVQNMRALPTPTLELTAEDTFTFDGGKVDIPWPAAGQAALDVQGIGTFGSSGEQKPLPIASVAKVMTTYLILREHPLKSGAKGPMIEIDDAAEKQSDAGQESTVDVTAGDKISQREALEAVLIASANNVARLVARWDAGSEEAFVEKMNKAAKDLGMTNTTYTDPSGLNNTTVSTAVDQVKLARAAMKQPAFREIAAMMSYDDYKGENHSNWNQLVGHNNVVGIKTGTTTSALGNLVFAAKKDVDGETRTIVGAVVRQPAGGADNTILAGALSAGDRLIRAAQDALESTTVLKKGTVVGYVDDGLGGRTPVALTEDVEAAGWAGLKVKLTFTGGELPHRAKAGTEVGSLTVGDGTNSGAVKVPVALQEDLVEPGFPEKLTRLG